MPEGYPNDGGAFGRTSTAGRPFGPSDDRFNIGKRLGKGGQGTVYECARVSDPSIRFAVKLVDLTKPGYKEKKGQQSLQREIKIMRNVFHPRIVNLHNAFWETDACFIVMDLAGCGDLYSKIEREVEDSEDPVFKGLGGAEKASKHVTLQLLDGIGYMHKNGISHRDMKLENVLITKAEPPSTPTADGPRELLEVKIADLGLSREMDDGGLKKMTTAVGTPDFVAPEVLDQHYDERADLWSLGAMVYAMLCGRFPFSLKMGDLRPERHKQVVSKINACAPWNNSSEAAKEFVQGLLTIDPKQRFGIPECLASTWLDDGHGASPKETTDFSPTDSTAAKRRAAIVKIRGSAGSFVDCVEFELSSGARQQHGKPGGFTHETWSLERSEMIIGLLQETGDFYLGGSFVFFTSNGRALRLKGLQANRRRTLIAPTGSEIVGMHFDGSELCGIHLKDLEPGVSSGSVAEVHGDAGHAVDSCEFRLRDGVSRRYGLAGGTAQGPWTLEAGEYIRVVDQGIRDTFLGNSLVFLTSTGRAIRLKGLQSDRVRVFLAAPGRQLCGIELQGSRIYKAHTCGEDGDLSQVETHRVANSQGTSPD